MSKESNKCAQTSKANEYNSNIEFFKEFGQVKSTTNATKIWLRNLEDFRRGKFVEEKIEYVSSAQELDKQLATYIAEMKQKNGQQYSASSIRCAIAAIHRHLVKNSVITGLDLHNQATFPTFWEVINGKIKFLSDLGLNDAKGADALTTDEISTILNHKILDGTTPERLLYRVYFYNAILLGIQVYIYHSKTNQRGAFGSRGKADKILIPYNEEIISYYEKYISLRPRDADPEFYLQEKDDEDAFFSGIWYKRNHVGLNRIKSLMRLICVNSGLNISNRKIVPHTGRKTMVQTLESLGETTLNIRKQSRHRSDESIRPYLSTGEKEQLRMMEHLAESLTSDNSKSRQKFQEITQSSNNTIISNKASKFNANNGTFKRASQIYQKSKDDETQKITNNNDETQKTTSNSIQLTISQDQLTKIIQSGALSNSDFNIKLV
ncbi:unnamed protein product [Rhizophagus irregularis]|nr:unnamed protein product [Rhizophagus irregularis]